jgi:hypothetical protein
VIASDNGCVILGVFSLTYAPRNAISAIGKLCEFCDGTLDTAQLLPLWLSWLPIKADVLEAQVRPSSLDACFI